MATERTKEKRRDENEKTNKANDTPCGIARYPLLGGVRLLGRR
jgi:hypothetical protein